MGDRLHHTHHRSNAIPVFRIITKIGMEVVHPFRFIIGRIIDHQFIHIGTNLLYCDVPFYDVRKVAFNRNHSGRALPTAICGERHEWDYRK